MKRFIILLLVVILLVLPITASAQTEEPDNPNRLARLQTINKSGAELEFTLTGVDTDYIKTFRIYPGTKYKPYKQNFDVPRGLYYYEVYYLEDPLEMGCLPNIDDDESEKAFERREIFIGGRGKLTFPKCYAGWKNLGEKGAYKFPAWQYIYKYITDTSSQLLLNLGVDLDLQPEEEAEG